MKYNNDFNIQDAFFNEDYKDCILCFEELIELDKEDLNSAYYALLSTIGENDLYRGLSLIKRSKLLSNKEISEYLDKEGANLINLLVEDIDTQKVVIIMTYINNHINGDMNDADMGLCFFEMIGSLYELGYKASLIKELTSIGHMLFKM